MRSLSASLRGRLPSGARTATGIPGNVKEPSTVNSQGLDHDRICRMSSNITQGHHDAGRRENDHRL
jgi:hypothetical protein